MPDTHGIPATPEKTVPVPAPALGSLPTARAAEGAGPDRSHLGEEGRARVKAVRESVMEQLYAMNRKIYGP